MEDSIANKQEAGNSLRCCLFPSLGRRDAARDRGSLTGKRDAQLTWLCRKGRADVEKLEHYTNTPNSH